MDTAPAESTMTHAATSTALVVEDDAHSALILAQLLEHEGMSVESVRDGRAAVDRITGGPATDVAIISATLPYIDGLEVLARLRASREWSGTVVIVLSGRGDENESVGALTSGANDYVGRPYSPRELVARIRRHRSTNP
jgi:DNA-binding response OmpR family regulator